MLNFYFKQEKVKETNMKWCIVLHLKVLKIRIGISHIHHIPRELSIALTTGTSPLNHLSTQAKGNFHFETFILRSFILRLYLLLQFSMHKNHAFVGGGGKATTFTDVRFGYMNQVLWPVFDVISYLKLYRVKKCAFRSTSLYCHPFNKSWKQSRKCWHKIILFSWHWSLRKRRMLKHYSFSISAQAFRNNKFWNGIYYGI